MNRGFTLIEMLIVTLIVAILTSIALPEYTRSIEKARATEAMDVVKALNDAVYAYTAEQNKCPNSFNKLLVTVPNFDASAASDTKWNTKYFEYSLNAATNVLIPGTSCGGVVAVSKEEGYKIWNPYKVINDTNKKRTLACTGTSKTAIGICKALGIYTTEKPY